MSYQVHVTVRRKSEVREFLAVQYAENGAIGAVKATYKMMSLMFKPNIVAVRINKTIVGAMNDKAKIKHIYRPK